MILNIRDIPPEGLELAFTMEPGQFSFSHQPAQAGQTQLAAAVRVQLKAVRSARNVYLRGRAASALSLVCGRCLKGYLANLDLELKRTLFPLPSRGYEEKEEPELEDMEVSFYKGEEIDLAHMVEEELLLSLPFRPLCQESCQGLCPGCGADLNSEPCRCLSSPKATPFQELEKLRSEKDA